MAYRSASMPSPLVARGTKRPANLSIGGANSVRPAAGAYPAASGLASWRRLLAARLGLTVIDATDRGEISEEELRAVELEEDQQRKDLTPAERSRDMVRRAEEAASSLPTGVIVTPPDSPLMDSPLNWRGTGQTRTDAAEAAGVNVETLRVAERHVAAVERYPELDAPEVGQAAATSVSRARSPSSSTRSSSRRTV